MTLPRLMALERYWASTPPLHEAFSRFVGMTTPIASPASEAAPATDGDPIENLIKDFGAFTSL
jgi:hypothetical protein